MERGPRAAVRKEQVLNTDAILKSRVQNSIETNPDETEKLKTRLVTQGRKDLCEETVAKGAPTILRFSIRIIFTFSATLRYKICSRDMKQAFVQSGSPLCRDWYIKTPVKPELMSVTNQPRNGFLHAFKNTYGLTESGGY